VVGGGAPCALRAHKTGSGPNGPFDSWKVSVELDPLDRPADVALGPLEVEPPDPRSEMEKWEERLEMWRGEYDIFGEQADPYLVALEEPGLSDEARELLDSWQKREAAAAAERREQARELEEMLRASDRRTREMAEEGWAP